jgi:hypothetical protein
MWRNAAGEHVLTGEPYGVVPTKLARLVDACHELDLEVCLGGSTAWHADALLVRVQRAKGPTPSDPHEHL